MITEDSPWILQVRSQFPGRMQRLTIHHIYIHTQVYIAHPGSAAIDCNLKELPGGRPY